MSDSVSKDNRPFEFDSPVEFVLIGVSGNRRVVVVRSKGAQIDLVAYAQPHEFDDDYIYDTPIFFPFLFPISLQSRPFSIDSKPVNFHSNHISDDRLAKCTFVWRGMGYKRDKFEIHNEFQRRVESIVEALEQESSGKLEWALSPIIDKCHKATVYSRRKKIKLLCILSLVMLIYVFGIIILLLIRFTR